MQRILQHIASVADQRDCIDEAQHIEAINCLRDCIEDININELIESRYNELIKGIAQTMLNDAQQRDYYIEDINCLQANELIENRYYCCMRIEQIYSFQMRIEQIYSFQMRIEQIVSR